MRFTKEHHLICPLVGDGYPPHLFSTKRKRLIKALVSQVQVAFHHEMIYSLGGFSVVLFCLLGTSPTPIVFGGCIPFSI